MKKQLIYILVCILYLSSCAKQSTPTGGPRDEDPPILLQMLPKNQSLNVKPEEILLTFDEYIKLDNASKNIIITPRLNKDEIIFSALKDQLRIELNQELEDSTTYVFNFQKSIQDLSEGNSTEDLKLVFSTGNSIDSLSFSGKTNFLFPSRTTVYEDVLVGLYLVSDSTDLFTSPPYYIAQADSTGAFIINNIRAGEYRAYAWKDDNNSLKAEYKSEEFSFINDTINIDQSIDQVFFNLSKADQTDFKLSRSSESGSNYLLVFNKGLLEFQIDNETEDKPISYSVTEDRVRLYYENLSADSIPLRIRALDSISQSIDTLIWAIFPESDRRKENLNVSVASGKSFYENLKMELTFSKPIKSIDYDSLYISYDTASFIPVLPEMISFEDSSSMDKMYIHLYLADSIPFDIFTLNAKDSTFKDMEDVYNTSEIKANFRKLKRESLADAISGEITGSEGPFILQLTNTKGDIVQEQFISGTNQFRFELIEPAGYRLKVIEDLNQNRRWDPANYSQGKKAERVFYLINKETGEFDITIRGGWTIENSIINATPYTGLSKTQEKSVDN